MTTWISPLAATFPRLIALAAVLIAGEPGAGVATAGEVLDRIRERRVMLVAADAHYPPQSFLTADDTFDGFDIQVAEAIAAQLGVEARFLPVDWPVVTRGDWQGRWDVSVGSMAPTVERAQVLRFPAVYYYTPAALVVNADTQDIGTAEDASGRRIGVGVATTYEDYLRGDLAIDAIDPPPFQYRIDGAEVVTFPGDIAALAALSLPASRPIDAVVTALPTALAQIANGQPLRIVEERLFLEPLAIAVAPGDPELEAEIAEAVAALTQDGTLRRLSQAFYGGDLTARPID